MKRPGAALLPVMSVLFVTAGQPRMLHALADEEMHVWRAQVEIEVGKAEGARTNDDVYLKLNQTNFTGLEQPAHNFRQAEYYRYDLVLTDVWKLKDIDFIEVGSNGTDTLCIRMLGLSVNNRTIFRREYLDGCAQVDANHKLSIPRWILEGSPFWQNYTTPPRPKDISLFEIMRRIWAVVGTDVTYDSSYYWSNHWGPPVQMFPHGFNNEVRVLVGVRTDPSWGVGVVNAPMDFKLRFECRRLSTGYPPVLEVNVQDLNPAMWSDEVDAIAEGIQEALSGMQGYHRAWGELSFWPDYEDVSHPCASVHLDPHAAMLRITWGQAVARMAETTTGGQTLGGNGLWSQDRLIDLSDATETGTGREAQEIPLPGLPRETERLAEELVDTLLGHAGPAARSLALERIGELETLPLDAVVETAFNDPSLALRLQAAEYLAAHVDDDPLIAEVLTDLVASGLGLEGEFPAAETMQEVRQVQEVREVRDVWVPSFLRGDCDGDGQVSGQVSDALFLLGFNFLGSPEPSCLAACDANGDGAVRSGVADAIYLLTASFLGGPPPPAPSLTAARRRRLLLARERVPLPGRLVGLGIVAAIVPFGPFVIDGKLARVGETS